MFFFYFIPLWGGVNPRPWARAPPGGGGAARARQEAVLLRLEADLSEQVAAYKAGSKVAALLRSTQLPQSQLSFTAALRAYESGGGPLAPAFDAQRRYLQVGIDYLRALVQQQASLAEIERIVGGEL